MGAIVEVDGWPQADGTVEAQEIETRTTIGSLAGQGPLAVEFANAALGHYFLTAFPDEIAVLDAGAFGGAWKRTGESFRTGGAAAVCRFYGMPPKGPDSHFFTVDAAECAFVMAQWQAWTFEAHAFATTPATCRRVRGGPRSGAPVLQQSGGGRGHEPPLRDERGGGGGNARQGVDRGRRRDVRAAVARRCRVAAVSACSSARRCGPCPDAAGACRPASMRRPQIDHFAPRTGAPIVAALPLRDALEEADCAACDRAPGGARVAATFR